MLIAPGAPVAPWLHEQLEALRTRSHHALLLEGPSGLGQLDLAMALAHTRLCDTPGNLGGCGHCDSCQMLRSRTHPDLLVLAPEVQLLAWEWPMDEKLLADLQGGKDRKPSKEIRVEAMRSAIEFCQRTSARNRGKVVLIHPAERMNAVTANALLKTLEEPAGELLFVLSSEASHQLLPTIRSRCQSHKMSWPQPQQARDWLRSLGEGAGNAADLLDAAGQRPVAALQMAQAGLTAKAWASLPKALTQGRVEAFDGFAGASLIDVMQKLAHDLWLVAAGAKPRFFEAADLPICRDLLALQEWSQELNRMARVAEHPFSAGLFLQAVVARGQRAVNSRP